MATKKIQGITIEIGGDTSKLVDSFNSLQKETNKVSKQLKDVEKGLKMNPDNVVLLEQKYQLLGTQVVNTQDKIDELIKIQEDLDKAGIDKLSDRYMVVTREIENNKAALEDLQEQAQETWDKMNPKELTGLKKIGSQLENLGNNLKPIGDKMQSIGKSMSTYVTAPLTVGFGLVTEGTREFRKEMGMLETNSTNAGANMDITTEAMKRLNAVTGDSGANVEAISNLLATGFKDNQMLSVLEQLAGAVITFPDTLKIEGLADGLQETLATGEAIGPFAELLERSGVSLDTFNSGLANAQANGSELDYIMQQLSSLGLNQAYEGFKNINAEQVKASDEAFEMQNNFAQIGEKLEPIMTKIKGFVNGILDWFNSLDEGHQNTILIMAGVLAALGPVLGLISTLITLLPALGAAFTVLSGPVVIAIGIIAALVAGGAALIANWNDISNKALNIWENISTTVSTKVNNIKNSVMEKFESIKNAIIKPVEAAKNAVGGIIDRMKNLFNFNWSLPRLKLPHITISGGFSLVPLRVPKFGISWYADGGIFNQPTILPTMNGLMGVGEHRTGGEVVAPLKQLEGMLNSAVANNQPNIVNYNVFTIDGKQVAHEVAPRTDYEFNRMQLLKAR